MPRKTPCPRKARAALLSLQLETTHRNIRRLRWADNAAEAALALRKSTPDWVELKQQLARLDLELEMEGMEAQIEAGKPSAPILDPKLVAHMRQKHSEELDPTSAPLNLSDSQYANVKRPQLPKGETYTHPGYGDHRHPADDWRNYED